MSAGTASKRPETGSGPAEPVDRSVLEGLVGYHLRRAQAAVFEDFRKTMAAEKITPGQYGVLALIGANDGLSQSALARALGIERSTMVAVIDGLETRGLVDRHPSETDRRSNELSLTPKGRALTDKLGPMVEDHEARMAEGLDADEKAILVDLLKRVGGEG